MRTKLMLPLAALLMIPAISGCDTKDKYEASFNVDQVICTHGRQAIDITLDRYVKNKMHFKDKLEKGMFELPDKYKAKEIDYAISYDKGASAVIVFKGDINNFTESSTSFDIKVKKEAFKESNLGGKITVSLFPNQITFVDFHNEFFGDTYKLESHIEVIGAFFDTDLIGEHSLTDISSLIDIKKNDSSLSSPSGTLELDYLHDDTYNLNLTINNASEIGYEDTIKLVFKDGATNLEDLKCEVVANASGPFLFETAN